MVITFTSEEELAIWGEEFGKILSDKAVIFLKGPMGAGKTTLVRAISKGYGVDEGEVSSPTFAIHNHMLTPDGRSIHHIDGYRIENPLEYEQIGLDMLPTGPVFIEWPEKCDLLRANCHITFTIGDNDERIVEIMNNA